jgi:hypothetical protein
VLRQHYNIGEKTVSVITYHYRNDWRKNMTVEDFVDSLHNKNNIDAEDAFKNVMAAKVGDALETKRKEVAGSFVKNHIPEVEEDEVEEDDTV